jgi:dolichol-phosphate mannosyltransferase
MAKFLIVIPTYNERESIAKVLNALKAENSKNDIFVLVVDDGSPDGTADYVDSLSLSFVTVLRRKEKSGLGASYRAGFAWGLQRSQFTHFVSMDGDGSHRASDFSLMANEVDGTDLVLGSRWMPGGAIVNWPKYREVISRTGTAYATRVLNLRISDITGGFKIYSRQLLEKIDINSITSEGYCFQIEMVMAAADCGAIITEVPITFVEREAGRSKMSQAIVVEALWKTTLWGLRRRLSIRR